MNLEVGTNICKVFYRYRFLFSFVTGRSLQIGCKYSSVTCLTLVQVQIITNDVISKTVTLILTYRAHNSLDRVAGTSELRTKTCCILRSYLLDLTQQLIKSVQANLYTHATHRNANSSNIYTYSQIK